MLSCPTLRFQWRAWWLAGGLAAVTLLIVPPSAQAAQLAESGPAEAKKPAAPVSEAAVSEATQPIIRTAISAKLYAFVAAVKTAGLVAQFDRSEPITVLMPTDDAFAKLPKGQLLELLKPENKQALIAVLNHHVFKGTWPAEKIKLQDSLTTFDGSEIAIAVGDDDQPISLGAAHVIESDIQCSNGLIHRIDSVLLPENALPPEKE